MQCMPRLFHPVRVHEPLPAAARGGRAKETPTNAQAIKAREDRRKMTSSSFMEGGLLKQPEFCLNTRLGMCEGYPEFGQLATRTSRAIPATKNALSWVDIGEREHRSVRLHIEAIASTRVRVCSENKLNSSSARRFIRRIIPSCRIAVERRNSSKAFAICLSRSLISL